MQKTLLGVLAGAVLCFAGASYANGGLPIQPAAVPAEPAHPGGWVIGVDAGYGELNTLDAYLFEEWTYYPRETGEVLDQSRDIGRFVWGAHVGKEFNVTENFLLGLEVGYKDLGRSKYKSHLAYQESGYSFEPRDYYNDWDFRVEQQAVDFLLTGKYYLWEGLNIFGKVGFAYVRSENESNYSYNRYDYDMQEQVYTENFEGYNYDRTIWRLKPEFALGVGYAFTPNFDIHLIYDYIHGESGEDAYGSHMPAYANGVGGTHLDPFVRQAAVYASNTLSLGISFSF